MKNILITFLALGTLCLNTPAFAASHITKVGTYGDGTIFVIFDTGLPGCTTATRFDITPDGTNDAAIKKVLSIAMAAKTSGTPVEVAVNGCGRFTSRGNFDSTTNSYIYLD